MKKFLWVGSFCTLVVSLGAQNIPFRGDALTYYSFSGNATNQLGSNYHLNVSGPTLSADRFGTLNSAYRFDGVNDFLVSTQTLPDTAEFTVAAWIRPESDHLGAIFYDAQFFTPGEDTLFRVQTGGSLFGLADKGPSTSSSVTANNVIRVGIWQHVAMTVRSSAIAVFVNGSLVATTSAGGNNVGYHSNFYIGGENHGLAVGNFFHGSIDELVFYNRALSAAEVQTLASFPTTPEPPTITVQPLSGTVAVGGAATFSVTAAGTSMLSYQWRKDGLDLPGATAATLSISNVQPAHLGDYSVVVSQASGSVTSSTASLMIPGVMAGIWRNLVAYYPFDGNAGDKTPYANHGTPAGNFQYLANGLSGGALRITGDNSLFYSGGGHVVLPRFGSFMNSGFTFSIWVKDEVIGSSPVNHEMYLTFGALDLPTAEISLNSGTQSVGYHFTNGTGNGRDLYKSIRWPNDLSMWKHLTMTYSPGRLAAYYNGVKVSEAQITNNIFPVANAALGRHWWNAGASSSARMSVTYDNVRIYSRALSDSDVQQLYATEAPTVGPAITIPPIVQSVIEGQQAVMTVTAVGSSPMSYQWLKNGAPIGGATSSTLTVEAARIADSGSYSVVVSNAAGTTTSATATLTVKSANPGRLTNLSIRTATGGANGTLIVGLVVGGSSTSGTSQLLVRASGPALNQFGVTGTLPDPLLTLYDGGRLIDSNDNWGGTASLVAAANSVGAFSFPAGSRDAAAITTLLGGAYTAQILDASGTAGVTLAEVYDANTGFSYTRPRLVNVSARANVGTGGEIVIAGFVVAGSTPLTVLVRAVGPGLIPFGVNGVLADPSLSLFRDATFVSANENWGDIGAATIAVTTAAVGGFALPTGSRDSAILATLQPGAYTAKVSGVGATTGIALVEVYEVP